MQTLHNFRIFCPNGILMRDGHVCEECPQHGLGCAVRHSCYRGSRAQSLVCAGIYAFHRLLGTYRKVNLITLTEFDRSKLLEFNRKASRLVFTPERLYCKPNGVAAPNHSPLPWAQRKNQIVFAGRLEELKGLRTAIEAWQLLGPDAPQLIVAGTGPLEAWAKENAPDTVTFTGQLPHGTLTELLAQSRAALCPSLCYESFALIPAEAHAVGTPVLASDLGNVGAAVQEGIDGLHFAPGNAAALADAVRKLQNVGETFDLTAMQQKACQAYNAEQNQIYRALHMPPKRLIKKLSGQKEIYTIAVRRAPKGEGCDPLPALGEEPYTPLPYTPGTWYADPLLYEDDNGKRWLFCEAFNMAENRGDIAVAEFDENDHLLPPRVVLKENFHLSFPTVFDWRGQPAVHPLPPLYCARKPRSGRAR